MRNEKVASTFEREQSVEVNDVRSGHNSASRHNLSLCPIALANLCPIAPRAYLLAYRIAHHTLFCGGVVVGRRRQWQAAAVQELRRQPTIEGDKRVKYHVVANRGDGGSQRWRWQSGVSIGWCLCDIRRVDTW